jgi:hypothetical protein
VAWQRNSIPHAPTQWEVSPHGNHEEGSKEDFRKEDLNEEGSQQENRCEKITGEKGPSEEDFGKEVHSQVQPIRRQAGRDLDA